VGGYNLPVVEGMSWGLQGYAVSVLQIISSYQAAECLQDTEDTRLALALSRCVDENGLLWVWRFASLHGTSWLATA
jgi:hypothetical protein